MSDETQRYWIIEFEGRRVGLTNLHDGPSSGTPSWAIYLADPGARGHGGVGEVRHRGLSSRLRSVNFVS